MTRGTHGNATWSDERVELLTTLWMEGNSAGAIAIAFAVSRNAIIGKVHRLNLPPRATTKSVRYRYWPTLSREEKAARQRERRERNLVRQLFARLKRLAPTPPETVVTEPDCEPRMVALLDLQGGECRYPFGTSPYLFCALPAVVGSYCAHHDRATHARSAA